MNPRDPGTRQRPARRVARAAARAALVPLFTACAYAATSFGTLDGATVSDVENASPDVGDLRIVREGAARPASVGMTIRKGDTIATSRTTRALITFRAGYEVTLDTATYIVVENPSIFIRFGQLFLKKLGITSDSFPVKTGHVSIVDSSTSFVVKVVRDDSAIVVVDEGVAVVRPRTGAWAPVRYHALQGGTFRGSQPPGPWAAVSRAEFDASLRWVRRVDALTRVVMPRLDSLSEAEARAVLARAGLKVLFVRSASTGRAAPGRVVDQSPSAGQTVARNTFVTFSIEHEPARVEPGRRAPTDTTRTPAGTPANPGRAGIRGAALHRVCTVPEIRNRSEKEALSLLKNAGLVGHLQSQSGRDYVATQKPDPTTSVSCGSTVEYTMTARIG